MRNFQAKVIDEKHIDEYALPNQLNLFYDLSILMF